MTQAWVANELPGAKIAELEEGVYDERITCAIVIMPDDSGKNRLWVWG